MTHPLQYLWRHPRRTGFIGFNVIALVTLAAWARFAAGVQNAGVAGVPNVALGYTGVYLLVAAILGAWLAWTVMLVNRRVRRRQLTVAREMVPPPRFERGTPRSTI